MYKQMVRTTVSLPWEWYEKVKIDAVKKRKTISEMMLEALREYLTHNIKIVDEDSEDEIKERIRQRMDELDGVAVKMEKFDTTAFIRKMRDERAAHICGEL